jgi:long-chain fatty acid transport protein
MKMMSGIVLMALPTTTVFAGGILTNTNQSISFLRNPARDGAIGIDGVYSNPAGVAFLGQGLHLGLNWQSAWQTRTITTTNPMFALGVNNGGLITKEYKGNAKAPVIPSVQAAYNTGKWSLQFNFSITGGGGKCSFDNGLGSFESAVANIAYALQGLGATGYDLSSTMSGRQYYFGVTLGAAYKVTDNLSVYGGLRGLIGSASYKAKISGIKVDTQSGLVDFSDYLDNTNTYITSSLETVDAGLAQLDQVATLYGGTLPEAYQQQYQQLVATRQTLTSTQGSLDQLEVYRNGVNLQSDQTGFGIAPIIGVDYRLGNFNFAARYEFRTKMSMKNKSTLNQAMAMETVNQFLDGTSVREDSPALLTVGAQWTVIPNVRINAGYHHFYDKQSAKYGDEQKLLAHGTNEYLGGVEWDPVDRLTVSGGFQITNYGMTDDYMSDLSFVVDSWSFGFGAKYKVSDKVAVSAAYFQTNYGTYNTKVSETGVQNSFTRTNNVAGVSVELDF